MKNLLILILFWGILAACDPISRQTQSKENKTFRTTPPSHLYFKNIRSLSYEQNTQPGTRVDLYKLRRFSDTEDRPILYPVIADNWMQDEAYLLIRPNDFEQGFSDTIRVFWKHSQDSGRYELKLANWPNQLRFAEQLYQGMQKDQQLTVETAAGERVPIFERKEDRLHFTTTMRDFYKLTEVR